MRDAIAERPPAASGPDRPLHVCLVAVEIFAWGKYGGFGRATRTIGRELARRGVRVSAVVPRREDQRAVEELDGITVYGFPRHAPWRAAALLRECDADVYHSQEPSWSTYLAQRARPAAQHLITFRDTRVLGDWRTELALPSLGHAQVAVNALYEDNPLVRRAVRHADATCCAAEHLIPKAQAKYRLTRAPVFLPTPVALPAAPRKAERPTVCFVARWDRRKRPELFFDLAREFPGVTFVAVGRGRDPEYEAELRRRYAGLANIEWVGFVDQFRTDELSRILARSWILVNTAAREGLPNSFIEAAAHGCAILSAVNPDGFATRFGYHAARDDFPDGLRHLIENDRWRAGGAAARAHAAEWFETGRAMDRHLDAYAALLDRPAARAS